MNIDILSPNYQWIQFAFRSLLNEYPPAPDCKLPVEFLIDAGALPYIDWFLVDNPKVDLQKFTEINPDYTIGTYGPLGLMFELRLKELHSINDVFSAHGVDYRITKGMAACFNVYADREECREMADIDLIVKPESFRLAINLLIAMGFELKKETISSLDFSTGQVPLKKQIGRVQINMDLHRYIHNYPLHTNLSLALFQNEFYNTVKELKVTHPLTSLLWELCHQTTDNFSANYRGLFDIASYIQLLSDNEWVRFGVLCRKFGLCDAAHIIFEQLLHLNQSRKTNLYLRISSSMMYEKNNEKLKNYSLTQLSKRGLLPASRKNYSQFFCTYSGHLRYSSNKINAAIAMCLYLLTRLCKWTFFRFKYISRKRTF